MKLFFFKRKSLLPWVVFFCVLSLSGLYLSMFLRLGWVPDDEGLLCQQAVRYLQGELPHRDFHETYTGGLTILSAWAFKIGGINALSLRYLLFGFSLLTLAFVFGIMRRGNTLGVASLLVLITLTWAYPNAYSGLPSWYVIGFWCVGVYCFERHRSAMEKGDQGFGWLLAAGVSAGLTVLMKISGIFFLAGAVLHLCHIQLARSMKGESTGKRRAFLSGVLIGGLILLHFSGTFFLFSRLPTAGVFINLLLPNVALDIYLGGLLVNTNPFSWRPLVTQILVLLGGFIGVLLPPLLWFLRFSDLNTLWTGIFVRPSQRTSMVTSPFPDVSLSGWGIVVGVMVAMGLRVGRPAIDKRLSWGLMFLLTAFMIMGDQAGISQRILLAMRLSPPFLVFVLLLFLWKEQETLTPDQRVSFFLPVVFLSLCSFIQFPSAYISYFFYLTPFVWFLLGRVVGSPLWKLPRSGVVFGIFFLLFGGILLNPAPFLGTRFESFDLPRASLVVPSRDKKIWGPLIRRIQTLVPNEKDSIFAGPDSPEIYFLADRPNPTKILYEILEDYQDQDSLEKYILEDIRKNNCRVVVVNLNPVWSKPFTQDFHKTLHAHFSVVELFDHFLLYSNFPKPAGGS